MTCPVRTGRLHIKVRCGGRSRWIKMRAGPISNVMVAAVLILEDPELRTTEYGIDLATQTDGVWWRERLRLRSAQRRQHTLAASATRGKSRRDCNYRNGYSVRLHATLQG